MDTNIEEILKIENTKFYMVLAEPMMDCLVTAIRHKQLSELSVVMWLKFKSEVHLRNPDNWTMACSLNELVAKFGKSKNKIIKCLKELERGGFISKQSERIDSHSNMANQIAVRFPEKGIELANTYQSRRGADSDLGLSPETNKLPTEVVQNLNQGEFTKTTVIKNTRKQKLEINKHTELSTIQAPPKPKDVDCCMAAPKDKTKTQDDFGDNFEQDPLIEKITGIENKIVQLQALEKDLSQKRRTDLRDLNAFQDWQKTRSALDTLELQLEGLKTSHKKSSMNKPPATPVKPATSGGKRCEPIVIPDRLCKKIQQTLQDFAAKKLVSDVKTLESQVKYQVANFEMGESLEHAANICLKLIKNNTFKAPGGYRADFINA